MIKLTSRPKRKCRFGPRARRKHGSEHFKQRSVFTTDSVTPVEISEFTSVAQKAELPKDVQVTQNQHPSFVEGQILPDRVTFQNICQTKSTPFDRYKFKVAATRQEGNSVTRAAKRLGISDQAFEESLKDEINELLNEIEATRRGVLHSSDSNSVSDCERAHGGEVGDSDSLLREVNLTDVHLPSNVTQLEGRHESHPFPLPKSRPKHKCFFGPKVEKGRQKGCNPIPLRSDSLPSAPPFRSTAASNYDEHGSCRGSALIRHVSGVSPSPFLQEEDEDQIILPDRPTFFISPWL